MSNIQEDSAGLSRLQSIKYLVKPTIMIIICLSTFCCCCFPFFIIATVGHQSATNKTASRYILSSIVSWVSLRLWLLGPHMIQLYVWRREYSQCFSHVYLSVQLKIEQNSDNALYTHSPAQSVHRFFFILRQLVAVSHAVTNGS